MPSPEPHLAARGGIARLAGALRHQLRLFFMALQFFTRVPVPRWVGFDAAQQHHAMRYFLAIGWLAAGVAIGVYALAALLWQQPVAVLCAIAAVMVFTGALHEDGMADTCDGFGAGGGPQRILAIMRDSHVGAFGVIGLGLTLALKCAALMALPEHRVWAALLLAHPLSRLACLPLIRGLPYARPQGKAGALVAQRISGRECLIGAATVLPIVLLAGYCGWLPWSGLACGLALAAASTWWLARWFDQGIGGYTGDCLGAVQQVGETMLYLGFAATLRF